VLVRFWYGFGTVLVRVCFLIGSPYHVKYGVYQRVVRPVGTGWYGFGTVLVRFFYGCRFYDLICMLIRLRYKANKPTTNQS
jgi:hypothetical protein